MTDSPAASRQLRLARPWFDELERAAIGRVLESGWIMQGEEVAAFEQELAAFLGCRFCVAVSSGTAALHIGMMALGVGVGDEVFVPSFAWPSAANVASLLEATVTFVDSRTEDFNLDPDDLADKLRGSRYDGTRFIVPIHQFGAPCDMEAVTSLADEHAAIIVEDAACALGTTIGDKAAGTLGRLGTFSFHPRKIITTGEGGAIVTDDDGLARTCEALRNHGALKEPGLNYRMTDLQAAIGRVQLAKLSEIIEKRQRLLSVYGREMHDTLGVRLPDYVQSTQHGTSALQTFMVVLSDGIDRDEVITQLRQEGIEATLGSHAAHRLPHFHFAGNGDTCPVATRLSRQGIALPFHPALTEDDVAHCAQVLRRIVSG